MTEIQQKSPANLAVSERNAGPMAAIIPRDIEEVWRYAKVVATAGYAPDSYKNDEAKIATAIMHGAEVGLLPMQAIQGIAVIRGMPTIWGDAALALVEASGLLEEIEESVEFIDDAGVEPLAATCRVKRRGRKGWKVHIWTMAQASKAGLSGKDVWEKYPQRMLQMRARSWCLRDLFPDVLKGLTIREEAQDFMDARREPDGIYRVEDAPVERPTPAPKAQMDGGAEFAAYVAENHFVPPNDAEPENSEPIEEPEEPEEETPRRDFMIPIETDESGNERLIYWYNQLIASLTNAKTASDLALVKTHNLHGLARLAANKSTGQFVETAEQTYLEAARLLEED